MSENGQLGKSERPETVGAAVKAWMESPVANGRNVMEQIKRQQRAAFLAGAAWREEQEMAKTMKENITLGT